MTPAWFCQSIDMKAYIRGIGIISPQHSWDNRLKEMEVTGYDNTHLRCIEPNYAEYIKPIQMRRMSRILKMGVAAAGKCLRDAGVEVPDAIITGTGLGMMGDTEKFLVSMLENDERLLTPTAFIQSTHNTVGAHIAVMLKCNKYNFTHVNDTLSFENTLLDGLIRVNENPAEKVLIAGIDEMTDSYFTIARNAGYWKENIDNSLELLRHGGPGSIAGEGAAFFIISGEQHPENYACFSGVRTFYKPVSEAETDHFIIEFLSAHGLGLQDVDILLSGINGDPRGDRIYRRVHEKLFGDNCIAYYKHLCGEYYTSSSFASWLGALILHEQHIPGYIILNDKPLRSPIKNILIYNHHHDTNHALILLSAC